MSINIGNFTVGLAEVVKWSDAAYTIGRLLVLFIIFFGLLYYLGRLSKEHYKLKKPSRFETDLRNAAMGLVFLIILIAMILIIIPYLKEEILNITIPVLIAIVGLIESVLLMFVWYYIEVHKLMYRKEPRHAIKKTIRDVLKESIIFGLRSVLFFTLMLVLLVVIIPILAIIFPNQQQLFLYLNILIGLIGYPLLIGTLTQPPEHKVSVYLTGTGKPLEDLLLYQTTDVDYRFKEGDKEIVIPISQIQKIVYKTPPKEEPKSVSSDDELAKAKRGGG